MKILVIHEVNYLEKVIFEMHEFPELLEEAKADIYKAAEMIRDLEHKFIDKIFEMGDLENLKKVIGYILRYLLKTRMPLKSMGVNGTQRKNHGIISRILIKIK